MKKSIIITIDMAKVNQSTFKFDDIKSILMQEALLFKGATYREAFSETSSLDNIVTKPYGIAKEVKVDLNTMDTYYRFPKLNLSRDKMMMVKEDYKVRKVLDKDKADKLIISSKTLPSLLLFNWNSSLSSPAQIRQLFTKHKDAFTIPVYDELISKLDNCEEDSLIALNLESSYYYTGYNPTQAKSREKKRFDNSEANVLTNVNDDTIIARTTNIGYIVNDKDIDIFNYINNNIDRCITDEAMNIAASQDSLIIDEEVYKNLMNMLKSHDTDNLTMAMNTMSNCNLEESKTWLALLFFHHSAKLRTGSLWGQVGFRAVKDKFQVYSSEHGYYHSSRYGAMIQQLAKDDALTVSAANHLTNIMFDMVINSSAGLNGNSVFQLDRVNVKLTDEVKSKIKDGKTLSEIILSPDYVDLPF